jgi:hypothetical protein
MRTHAVLLYPTAVGGLDTACVPQPLLERFKVWGIAGRLWPDCWRWVCDSFVVLHLATSILRGQQKCRHASIMLCYNPQLLACTRLVGGKNSIVFPHT